MTLDISKSIHLEFPDSPSIDRWLKLLAVIGILLILIGAGFDLPTITCGQESEWFFCNSEIKMVTHLLSLVFLGTGSAFIGAGITQLAANKKSRDLLNEVGGIFANTVAAPALYSKEEDIQNFRKDFFGYSATQMGGVTLWRVFKMNLNSSLAINRLLSREELINPRTGKPESERNYGIEAFIRENNFIYIHRNVSSEPPSVRIFPNAGLGYVAPYCGFAFHINFDHENALNRIILSEEPLFGLDKPQNIFDSEKPLFGLDKPQNVFDPALVAKLHEEWKSGTRKWILKLES